jgi:CO dehydrogenase maturation factor
MGVVRSSGQGCMCPANALIRAILRHLLIRRNEVVIIDMEAGTEHFGRGTAETVDVMLIVTDATLKSLETAKHICRLSTDMGVKEMFIIGNRVFDDFEEKIIRKFCEKNHLPLLALIPHDDHIRKSDAMGKPLNLSHKSSGFRVIRNISEKLNDYVGESLNPS